MTERITLRFAEGDRFRSAYLTGTARPGPSFREEARSLFGEAAAAIASGGILPVREIAYGITEARGEALAIRRETYAAAGLDPETPCTFIQGKPIDREDLAGLQVFGIAPREGGETTVTTTPEGRLLRGPDLEILYAPGIDGLAAPRKGGPAARNHRSGDAAGIGRARRAGPGGDPAGDRAAGDAPLQAERMFRNAEAALEAAGFTFRDVARTWIYLKRILDWYGAFNGVRTAFFDERGVGAGADRSFPASTGIQGTAAGEECTMDLLAVKGEGVAAAPIHESARQGRSFEYGSAFSRAVSLEIGGVETIHVSGTASIDTRGGTLHRGDAEGQILETLLCIAALLAPRGAGLKEIHQATLFCKTPEILGVYRRVTGLLRIPSIPVVPVLADICRPDLLVEIEATAVAPPRPKTPGTHSEERAP